MKLKWTGIQFEYRKIIVLTKNTKRSRSAYERKGWTFVSQSDRDDGKSELSFKRSDAGTVTVTP